MTNEITPDSPIGDIVEHFTRAVAMVRSVSRPYPLTVDHDIMGRLLEALRDMPSKRLTHYPLLPPEPACVHGRPTTLHCIQCQENWISERKCIRCGKPITKSDGGVLARDLTAFREGKIKGSEIREQCGHCVLRPDAIEYLEQLP